MKLKTISAFLSMAFLSAAASYGDEPKRIETGDFSSDLSGWELSLGAEFPGAEGNLWRAENEGVDGKGAASLQGSFKNGGNYVSMGKTLGEAVDAKTVTLRVKSSDLSTLVFRITDSTGQTFQQAIKLKPAGDWQSVSVTAFSGKAGVGYWGGANDGQWHPPAKGLSIIVDKGNLQDKESLKGTLLVDKIELEY